MPEVKDDKLNDVNGGFYDRTQRQLSFCKGEWFQDGTHYYEVLENTGFQFYGDAVLIRIYDHNHEIYEDRIEINGNHLADDCKYLGSTRPW